MSTDTITEIYKEDLDSLDNCTLISFFDGNIEYNRFNYGDFKPVVGELSSCFKDTDLVQVGCDFMEMSIDIVGTAGKILRIIDRTLIIKFIKFFCEFTNTSFMLSYDNFLLNYQGEEIC